MGVFQAPTDFTPDWVGSTGHDILLERISWHRVIPCLGKLEVTQSSELPSSLNTESERGLLWRVRVVEVTQGEGKTKLLRRLFYGKTAMLQWDPGRFRWLDEKRTPLLAYSTKMGRRLLATKHVIPNVITRKWQGILPASYKF